MGMLNTKDCTCKHKFGLTLIIHFSLIMSIHLSGLSWKGRIMAEEFVEEIKRLNQINLAMQLKINL